MVSRKSSYKDSTWTQGTFHYHLLDQTMEGQQSASLIANHHQYT